MSSIESLIKKEGWEIQKDDEGRDTVLAFGETFPLVHPFSIYAKLYRNEINPEQKYRYMKAMHDILWPNTVWHYWTERRFRAHCNNHNYISFAGGTSTSKSYDTAKIGILWWLGDPHHRGLVVASTSLDSLNSRIWGYMLRLLASTAIPISYDYQSSKPPKILNVAEDKKKRDFQHGIFAVAAKQGDDETTISSWIGRHPDKGLMLILDEGTDMPPALMEALPNLEGNQPWFQCFIIGNSNSKFDLHGAMSTPKAGWNSVNPEKDFEWETTQKNGICLFFNCYDSPAIHEPDPLIRERLSKFLITMDKIKEKEIQYGKTSDKFWRMIIGFWKKDTSNEVVISEQFLTAGMVGDRVEWSGLFPLNFVSGLDPAFSTGGDSCILRLAILGVDIRGFMVLDFRKEELLFPIKVVNTSEDDAAVQIAKETNKILRTYGCKLGNLTVDANGQGRALAPLIQYEARDPTPPSKIYSTAQGGNRVRSFDVHIKTSLDLWFTFRDFIANGQIKGLDGTTMLQMSTRLVILGKNGKQQLESKVDYKKRMGAIMPSLAHSPDEADAAALALQSAILKFGFHPGQRHTIQQSSTFEGEKLRIYKEEQARAAQMRQANTSGLSFAPPKMNFKGNLISLAKNKRSF